jgi:TonB family protein
MPAPEPVMRSTPVEPPRLPALLAPVRQEERHAAIADLPKPVVNSIAARPVEHVAAMLPIAAPSFERPIEKAPERPPEIGLFERTSSSRTSQSAASITTDGFARATTTATSQPSDAVTTGGFGSVAPSPRASAKGADDVQTAGFDRRASAPAQSSVVAPQAPVERPVEIVFKPTPEYTDEARSARIEGTVTLDLEFTAAGDVRVLRVVHGLGHGLDEAAERAALRIRFKPAQSDGRAVDSHATVHITFRLS